MQRITLLAQRGVDRPPIGAAAPDRLGRDERRRHRTPARRANHDEWATSSTLLRIQAFTLGTGVIDGGLVSLTVPT